MGTPIFDDMWNEVLAHRDAATTAQLSATTGALGIDTSSWQSVINWAPVAASGRSFAYIKASEGNSTFYATLNAQYQGAVAAGLSVGLYHYAQPNISPTDNADAFALQINRLGAIDGHLPPALDLEVGTGDLSGWAASFIARLRQQTGCQQVCVYSDVSFLENQIGDAWMDDDTLIWAADFSAPAGQPRYASPKLAIHQYSQIGQVPGVQGDVDLNVALRPLNQLIAGGNDVTDEEHQMLVDLQAKVDWMYGQFAGLGADGQPAPFPTVPGWPTLPGGTNQNLSFLDFSRETNAQIQALHGTVLAVLAAVAPGSGEGSLPAAVSAADAELIAQQVVTEFATKLSQQIGSGRV